MEMRQYFFLEHYPEPILRTAVVGTFHGVTCNAGSKTEKEFQNPAFVWDKIYILISVHGDDLKYIKSIWWMPWRIEAMKDVLRCDKRRLAAKKRLTRRFPNGETRLFYSHL